MGLTVYDDLPREIRLYIVLRFFLELYDFINLFCFLNDNKRIQ